MGKVWVILIAISIFLIITFLYYKLTRGYAKKGYGNKMWKQWGTRTFYWQGAIFMSSAVTILIVILLKWVNVLPS